ncbi:hypothetical protein [Nocardioides sp. Kera G14]|uniref:hypothetical protein n=1 Tax=Nocardioides sp. Kera G14 TaxID=2884264 RepID=UPI001D0F891A|nr:hypothetical protein [Nocardioides sp. Kera G14]UDY24668.1 hypothetical protein LH076_05015 [Nocardioides sp. Kera G14]
MAHHPSRNEALLLLSASEGMSPEQRRLAMTLCLDAIVAAPSMCSTHVGRIAREGAELLLGLEFPELGHEMTMELARTCERIAVSRAYDAAQGS